MTAPWRLVPFGSFLPRENMAIDEAIFREVRRVGGPPTLRFYGWQLPAVSIGYFQGADREIDWEACRDRGITVVRRPTGGKAVYHEDDLTYAVIAPENHPLFPPTIIGTYSAISRCLVQGLNNLGIPAVLAAEDWREERAGKERKGGERETPKEKERPSACFAVPSRCELLVAGRKICGSAQMRSRGTFLQQGSLLMSFVPEKTCSVLRPRSGESPSQQVQALRDKATAVYEHLPRTMKREDICRRLLEAFEDCWEEKFAVGGLTPAEAAMKNTLLATKYEQDAWNREGRAP